MNPGTSIQRRAQVDNNSTEPQSVRVYAGAADIVDGTFVGGADPQINDLTTWTSFDEPKVFLQPGESVEVLVTVDVPSDASEGEQYAVIWAEVSSDSGDAAGIVHASRVGIRMYVSVGPGNGEAADFTVTTITAARSVDGTPAITALATNTGGRALDIAASLILNDGPASLSAGPFTADKRTTLAPGDSGTVLITLADELPNGPWNATLTLTSGLVEREAQATITFPSSGEGQVIDVTSGSPLPWFGAGTAILLVGGVLVWGLHRRRVSRKAAALADAANSAAASVSR